MYDYGARFYDPSIAQWNSVDPLAAKYPGYSSYNYVMGNPIKYIDPDGMQVDSPIYGTDGNFLGTDDQGIQGRAIVMNSSDFTQGMSHSDAESKDLGLGAISSSGFANFMNHKSGLSSRPDYDGYVTISEGIDWARSHPNAMENPTADNTLYINTAKLDFGYIFEDDFPQVGVATPQNLFSADNLLASVGDGNIRATTYALGRVDMVLHDRTSREVSVVNNAAVGYDWNRGGGTMRSMFIDTERARTGLNDSHGFRASYYGRGTLANKRRRKLGLDRLQ